ncbi:type II 3-dehydroquinate dehydratase [Hyphomicrobiales bacterium]|jgi:3-dehydroquinate dehydratase-2|nr:type II 3-dehydroquinate dehydratase [Hyphomicrobiales bacterium]MDB9926847.1 type II 3-dehydroquinate dehydratase [Hyphomicrobiales bacterium]|tara:strand:- start:1863 stop:2306 length:444 start_codon:yes stop_codon:yes gene_type:complete
MTNRIHILNGPNLNLLGEREPDIYGVSSLKDIENNLVTFANRNEAEVIFRQTNHEGELIELIHEAGKNGDGVIINPAGYTHTSIALYDALLALNIPIIEVHISNIYKREKFRHSSYVSMAANSVISGLGVDGYTVALESMLKNLNSN